MNNEDVQAQLERILDSPSFRAANQTSVFLRYTVEKTLAGESAHLKETLLGVEVCGRPRFDPRTDTVVRSTASRLRNRLAEYYAGPGAEDPIVIEYPRGGYVPVWRLRQEEPAPGRQPEASPRHTPKAVLIAALAVAAAAAVGVARWQGRETDASGGKRPVRFEVQLPAGHTAPDLGSAGSVMISPDARLLAACLRQEGGASSLWVHQFETGEWRRLAGTERAYRIFWSPDSRHIGFFLGLRGIFRVPVEGAPVRPLVADVTGSGGAAWFPDGRIVFGQSIETPLMAVSDQGGAVSPLTKLAGEEVAHVAPFPLPDGRRFLFTALHRSNRAQSTIYLASLDRPGEPRRVIQAHSNAAFVPEAGGGGKGMLLYAANGALVGQPLQLDTAAAGETQTVLVPQVAFYPFHALADFSVARDGTLVFRHGPGFAERVLARFTSGGKRSAGQSTPGLYRYPSVSPDGKWIATEIIDPITAKGALWILDAAFGNGRRLTAGNQTAELGPIWSPDGRRLAYVSNNDIYVRSAGPLDTPIRLTNTPETKRVTAWSPDGRELLFYQFSKATNNHDVLAVNVEPGSPIRPLLTAAAGERDAVFSPDGRYVAYVSDHSGNAEIFVEPYPLPPTRSQAALVSPGAGANPRWNSRGDEVIYLAESPTRLVAVPVNRGVPQLPPRELFAPGMFLPRGFGMALDPRSLDIILPVPDSSNALSLPTVILNPALTATAAAPAANHRAR